MSNSSFNFLRAKENTICWCLLPLVLAAAVWLYYSQRHYNTAGEDIFYLYEDGRQIASGENPYARIHGGNMRENRKYSTYLPLFYLLSAASQKAGLVSFESWVAFWKIILWLSVAVVGVVIFGGYSIQGMHLAGVLLTGFWLFNRWTLHLAKIAQIDALAILFLLLAMIFFQKRTTLAFLCLGTSLAVKQMAVFVVPLFLLTLPPTESGRKILCLFCLLLVPLAASLPFLIWDLTGFVKSIAFSATRNPADHFGVPSADSLLGWVGLPAKIPLLTGLGMIFLLAWRRMISLFTAVFLSFALLVDFNSVLFRQYLVWPAATLALAASDWMKRDKSPTY